jgi:hypothetical protein
VDADEVVLHVDELLIKRWDDEDKDGERARALVVTTSLIVSSSSWYSLSAVNRFRIGDDDSTDESLRRGEHKHKRTEENRRETNERSISHRHECERAYCSSVSSCSSLAPLTIVVCLIGKLR